MVRPKASRERREAIKNGRYKGVRMRKWDKWVAEVRQPKSRDRIWLGSYETPEEAARACDAAVFCLRGPSAFLNFPNDPHTEVPSSGELSAQEIQVAASRHARTRGSLELVDPSPTTAVAEFGHLRGGSGSDAGELWRWDCYLVADERDGGEDDGGETTISTSAFMETPYLWSFLS